MREFTQEIKLRKREIYNIFDFQKTPIFRSDRASMESPGPPGQPPSNTIFCLFCRATIYFPGLPANRYLNHLFAEHNIMYEVQSVINRTL